MEAKERYTDRDQDEVNKGPAIDELSSKELVECHLYSQRMHAIHEIDERLAKVNEMNDQLAQELKDLETQVEVEKNEIGKMYDESWAPTRTNRSTCCWYRASMIWSWN